MSDKKLNVTEIYVKFLVSFEWYNNAEVGLKVAVGENEDWEEVFNRAAEECAKKARLLPKIYSAVKVEEELEQYKKRLERLQEMKQEIEKTREELAQKLQELGEVEKILEEKKSIIEKLKEKLLKKYSDGLKEIVDDC